MSQKELLYPIAMNEDSDGNLYFILKGSLIRDAVEVIIRRCPTYSGSKTSSRSQMDLFLKETEVKTKLISKMRDTFGRPSEYNESDFNFTDVFLSAVIRYIEADAECKISNHLEEISDIDRHACNMIDRGLSVRAAWREASGMSASEHHADHDSHGFHDVAEAVMETVRTIKEG